MPILGAHQSIAGGYYKAIEIARARGCDCVQLFTKNNNQWRAKPISDEEAARFRETLTRLKITHPIAHNSYLINLAAPDDALWRKSIDAMVVEVERAGKLGIPYLVTHPGAFTSSSEVVGLARVAEAIDEIHRLTPSAPAQILLETTAGQGTCLGAKFEHLAAIFGRVRRPELLGVCVDTCHVFAAGYPLGTEREYRETFQLLDAAVGIPRVKAFHLNDSAKPLGSRVDRHAHIGRGCLGREPFRHLLNDPRFCDVPMYLETPKETVEGREMDEVNLETLRGLVDGTDN